MWITERVTVRMEGKVRVRLVGLAHHQEARPKVVVCSVVHRGDGEAALVMLHRLPRRVERASFACGGWHGGSNNTAQSSDIHLAKLADLP